MRYNLVNTSGIFKEYAVILVQDFYSMVDNDCEYGLSVTDNILDATSFKSINLALEIRELVCEDPNSWEVVLFTGGNNEEA